jgi:hypothetical protein
MGGVRTASSRAAPRDSSRVRLKPADSFGLIRLIARSQSDPRKAVAELVQNSLDAGAAHVRVTWYSHKGRRAVSVWDDGTGVFAELLRPDALRRIATTVGASHKAHFTPEERHRQMTLGKYGIGLLGFWSVGRFLEIRTRVAGSDVWVLRLERDRQEAELFRQRAGRLPLDETFTEVVITEVSEAAAPHVKPRRLAAYLAGELRGQLLARDVRLEIHDKVARGLAAKHLVVKPERFRGAPLAQPSELPVPGHATARVELYLVPESEERRGLVALACGGSTVLDDLASIDGAEAPREPWSMGRFEGVVDFPDLAVAPAARRGFVPDEASSAFREALPSLEARCREILSEEAARRAKEREADDVNDIRRMFRRLPRALPHYALFDVRDGQRVASPATSEGEPLGRPDDGAGVVADPPPAPEEPDLLYPPGPLASVEIRPKKSVIPIEGERRLRAVPRDADGRELTNGVTFAWRLDGAGALDATDVTDGFALYRAPGEPCEARLLVVASQGELRAEAAAELRVADIDEPDEHGGTGVPDPEPVAAPAEEWRSRLMDGRWQYNTAHRDYLAARDDARRRLRYLVHLFAKEVVLRNFGEPGDAALLERMVQVLTYVGDVGPRKTR